MVAGTQQEWLQDAYSGNYWYADGSGQASKPA